MKLEFLDDLQVCRLTGYKRPKQQAQFLSDNGIKFIINADGQVVVSRDWLNGWDKYVPVDDDGFNEDFLNAS